LQRRAQRKQRMLETLIQQGLLPQELSIHPQPEIILNVLGDMLDDPDVQTVLNEIEQDEDLSDERAKEESAFKKDIAELRREIALANCRTLGEYLAGFGRHQCRRNRAHDGGHLRTDRQMYQEELDLIWQTQQEYHPQLTEAFKETIERIIFYQRPLKLKADRIGKCSLEPKYN